MIYITGDPHGHWEELERIAPLLHSGDKLIFAGDCNYGMVPEQEKIFDQIEHEMPFEILLLDGNHEDFDALNALPIEEWSGGKVHRIRKNMVHLMRGEIFQIEGHTIFTLGGGHSPDKARLMSRNLWWKEELPSQEEICNAEEHLRALREKGKPLDFIITHVAPSDALDYLSCVNRDIRNVFPEELELVSSLNRLSFNWNWKMWYFGHLHIDVELMGKYIALLHAVRELETGKIVGWKYQMPQEQE